jgi:transposase
LAQTSIGLQDPSRLDEFEITTLAGDLVDALTKAQLWLDKAIELLAHRADYQRLLQLPRIGKPTAAALLTALGDIHEYQNGKHLVKLAGLDLRLFESGSSIRKLPQISHVGSAYLRYWLSHYAMRLIAHEPHFNAYYQRRKQQSPGKGSGQRALIAVCDKAIRMISRILTDHAPYDPQKDKSIAEYDAAQRQAASA